jgi:hypothetical protein
MSADAITHFGAEVSEKVKSGQAKLVAWESIKDNPPPELKISPISAIPHISKQFRSILVLSFHLQLKQGGILPSVNATTIKTAPRGAIDQLGHSLTRIIHAFAKPKDEARIFMANRRWRQMEFRVRSTARTWQTYLSCGTHFPPNGMGRVPSVLLRGI